VLPFTNVLDRGIVAILQHGELESSWFYSQYSS
jgi:hypothetical protein